MNDTPFDPVYPGALRAAQVRSAVAAASGFIPENERSDLEQDLVIAAWRALPTYNPSRSSIKTFTEHIVVSKLASFMRQRRRQTKFETLEEFRLTTLAGIPKLELHLDVQRVIVLLNGRDRQVSQVLMEYTPTEVGRRLGISRAKVYRSIVRLRMAFASAGFTSRRYRGTDI